MSIGENLGNILLEIVQTNILKGETKKGLETYTKYLNGCTEEHAFMLLKNQAVLITSDDHKSLSFSTDPKLIEENAHNIFDWETLMEREVKEFHDLRDIWCEASKQLRKHRIDGSDYNIMEKAKKYWGVDERGHYRYKDVGTHNLLARVLANNPFDRSLHSNGESIWLRLCDRVEMGVPDVSDIEFDYYWIAKYVWTIRQMHKQFVKFCNVYDFLETNGMVNHYTCIESTLENIFEILNDFCNPNTGYYHPMCDEQISNLKEQIIDDMLKNKWGKEFLRYGIIAKEITDGYDAGYLAPDGTFYGAFGPTSAMIHMNLADQLFKKKFNAQMTKDGVTEYGSLDPEQWLTREGYIKIHDKEVYGYYKWAKDDKDTYAKLYAPTPIQIQKICEYADRCHNGNIHTQPQIVTHTDPIKTYQLKQMDEIKLHEIFGH